MVRAFAAGADRGAPQLPRAARAACPCCGAEPTASALGCAECGSTTTDTESACGRCGGDVFSLRCEGCQAWSPRSKWTVSDCPDVSASWPAYRVGPRGADFRTIADAVRCVHEDARILVTAGAWRESVSIEKRVALIGDGDVVWESPAGSPCLVVSRDVQVRGVRFRSVGHDSRAAVVVESVCKARFVACGFSADEHDAIVAQRGVVTLVSGEITGAGRVGLKVDVDGEVHAEKLSIASCREAGIVTRGAVVLDRVAVRDSGEAGIVVGRGARARILGSRVTGSAGSGVSVLGDAEPELLGTEIAHHRTGLWASDDSRVRLRDCRFAHNGQSIVASGRAEAAVSDCTVATSIEYGLSARDRATVSGSRVTVSQASGVALTAEDRASVALTDVRIDASGNATAVVIRDHASALLVDCTSTSRGSRGIVVDDDASLTIERGALRHPTNPLHHGTRARVRLEQCSIETLGAAEARHDFAPVLTQRAATTAVSDLAEETTHGAAVPADSLTTSIDEVPAAMIAPPAGPAEFQPVLAHLEAHGSLSEAELIAMVGARRARAFARRCEELTKQASFRVRIEVLPGAKKMYVKDGGR